MTTLKHERLIVAGKDITDAGTRWLEERIVKAIQERGVAIIGLSGGSTPGPIYEKLGQSNAIDFTKCYAFMVDERHIAEDHKDSNTLLLRNTLLKGGKFLEENLVRPNTSLPIDQTIRDYDTKMRELFKKGNPDIVCLGLGPDGHLASIFPPANIDAANREDAYVLHTTTEKFAVFDRITVNFIVIRKGREQVFFMKGADKVKVWDEMIGQPNHHERWPAQKVIEDGHTTLIASTD
ncbi:hypothetical protein PROFUN_06456 [Planoprotostelium fungivorum]|uniref:6-phosphogluconolactonase n=1 Tax=Planoprotostelium fungivorum TaxID=1890364 RepID=A0A2P6MQZ2_9EUKA|nr:hypothetical protein PROFUN_06456 [Planoprotostelium fungivorum]